ncbi:MAG: hypothetical protein AAGI71_01805 [Bacteroidota bacterium]
MPSPIAPAFLRSLLTLCLVGLVGVVAPGCQTLREVTNLRNVRFNLDNVNEAALAGVSLGRLQSFSDLGPADLLRLGAAVRANELPFAFTAQIGAENPAENNVNARMVEMDWTLLIDDQRLISGVFNQPTVIAPGERQLVALPVEVDLIAFFGDNLRDLVDLALAVSGQGGSPSRIQFEVQPTIETSIGPIRYPNPIRVINQEVGP